jgi:ATP-dependent helicase YprA (DUF1998 family)
MRQTIQETIQQLHAALGDYIEATYHISSPSLISRRKALLDDPGVIHQVPYLESTPRYEAGDRFAEIEGLPPAALEVYSQLTQPQGSLPKLLFDPPYKHQAEALKYGLVEGRNLVIMTGTGSGKTESFLLPILGKLAREAQTKPNVFASHVAMRALLLYPMNALVNDQLGRLRALLGDPRLVRLFKEWSGRPARFARYTSRTPYAGVRTSKKDSARLNSIDDFYVDILRRTRSSNEEIARDAQDLFNALRQRGKWPAKPDLEAWFGQKGSAWQDRKTGAFVRAVTLEDDSELLTRDEVQAAPPDLLVTNYSMLEYMLMRPIERPIFDRTREWLKDNPDEKFLVVLDEAHLYRGAAGAEVGLLLRRFRDRLGVSSDQFQMICATASFNKEQYAPHFGAQLSGSPATTFRSITGTLSLSKSSAKGNVRDAEALSSVELGAFYQAEHDEQRLASVRQFLKYRGVAGSGAIEKLLFDALSDFEPMGLLIDVSMQEARAISELGALLFPGVQSSTADAAVTVLMALGSIARPEPHMPGLLPCRIHNFFRGLPGLWVCMDANCTQVGEETADSVCGKMYSQPRDHCACGARVLELFTCRNCGTAYARAYTDDVDTPSALWPEAGERLRMPDGETRSLLPLDLLLESPASDDVAEPADYDLETGRINPRNLGKRMRTVYLRQDRVSDAFDEDTDSQVDFDARGQFIPCAVCGKTATFGRSSVQDHQTKGDQPFQALLARQIQIQPPGPGKPTRFAPLQGRKVLAFSDSRQVAARLAPNIQMYSVRDSLRPLIAWGYTRLQRVPALEPNLNLEDLYLAVLLASKTLGVRLRPELKPGETFAAEVAVEEAIESGATDTDFGLQSLLMEMRNERPPEALLDNVVTTILDRFLGFEALALASIVERRKHTNALANLPSIPHLAETPEAKIGLARAWLRCWQSHGFWLSAMPPVWWRRPRTEGVSIRGQKGKFKAMETLLQDKSTRKQFWDEWSPILLSIFTQESDGGTRRLRGSELSLLFDEPWIHCRACKSVHRPVVSIPHCLDCGSPNVVDLDSATDPVFLARKGFYRRSVVEALADPPRQPMALIAAEHTAQLNAPQNQDVFSKAEENELLFQDIALTGSSVSRRATAIDILSSTTTMEVGIDLGALSGVALRNMPPSRANYQQRAGRAGRRGTAVATVVAFGSADSHDEHYFSEPEHMIRGPVVDPQLTLDNPEIVRRHVRAFLLQTYHQSRIRVIDPAQRHDLFSVLGTVSEFRKTGSILSRDDFAQWLEENDLSLQRRVSSWIPSELSVTDRTALLTNMKTDCLRAVDDAIRPGPGEVIGSTNDEDEEDGGGEDATEAGEETAQHGSSPGKLLNRLLYCGKLPRYAFPTDVATFHVFDRDSSTRFRPILKFAPSQGLPIALTQYAPGKQVWISGKCYTSGALYSVMHDDRHEAWSAKRLYMECAQCGFARTFEIGEVSRNETRDCEACGSHGTFGPARYWLRPPGFAHPVDIQEVTSPDDIPETSYATRAKLTMGTPEEDAGWTQANARLRSLSSRQHLLVSNTGPERGGYTYCTSCGRIEASTAPNPTLVGPHRKPYPDADDNQVCDGINPTRHLVLGTDFITDIVLFSMRVESPLSLTPGQYPTLVALRTLSEALAKSACDLLELEIGEVMAEFRPALTPHGAAGLETEIFLYDTLPGGAGFASQFAPRCLELFEHALKILRSCPEGCDSSCYRCLRSFKNKFEHELLDRHVGAELLEYLLTNKLPQFDNRRVEASTALLYQDLQRQGDGTIDLQLSAAFPLAGGGDVRAPILATANSGERFIIGLAGPLTSGHPADLDLLKAIDGQSDVPVLLENELLVRRNLPAATRMVQQKLRSII